MEKEQPTSSQPEPEQKLTESLPAAAADEDTVELEQLLATQLNLGNSNADNEPYEIGVGDLSLDGLLKQWNTKGFRKIITMVGAGISTSAGIPDFRSPGTGLYDNLQKYNLPYPMAIFDINFFRKNPDPFFTLAKELYPGNFNPTASHYFVRLLHEKGLLQRHYTQNIDTLERVAGIPENKLVEAHGTFHNNHCIQCNKAYDKEWVRERVFANQIPKCTKCKNVVKPDIVFFGENLPEIFYKLPQKDFPDCDLLIVMGTSLEVYPFCTLLNEVGTKTPRLVINRTNVLDHEDEANTRDIVFLGDCDDGVWAICKALGWTKQLKKLILRETAILEEQRLWKTSVASSSASSSAIELNNELSKTENDKEKKKK